MITKLLLSFNVHKWLNIP